VLPELVLPERVLPELVLPEAVLPELVPLEGVAPLPLPALPEPLSARPPEVVLPELAPVDPELTPDPAPFAMDPRGSSAHAQMRQHARERAIRKRGARRHGDGGHHEAAPRRERSTILG
jgi:hypothetical protein